MALLSGLYALYCVNSGYCANKLIDFYTNSNEGCHLQVHGPQCDMFAGVLDDSNQSGDNLFYGNASFLLSNSCLSDTCEPDDDG